MEKLIGLYINKEGVLAAFIQKVEEERLQTKNCELPVKRTFRGLKTDK